MFKFIQRWHIFCKERFPIPRHILLIVFYVSANALVALGSVSLKAVFTYKETLTAATVLAIFFHLRIFDEIKDYKKDTAINGERPLARGIISIKEAKRVAFYLVILELIMGSIIGLPAFIAVTCAALYSLVMYKEFFIGAWLRPRMATYAMAHTLVSCWMAVFVFSAVTESYFWKIPKTFGMFVIVNWMIFNVFEFGRKTFGKEEEKDSVDSYSKRLGPVRASGNVIIMVMISAYSAYKLGSIFDLGILYDISMCLLFGLILLAAWLYAAHNDILSAKFFRGACSAFILFYNVIITIGMLSAGGGRWMY